MRRYVDEHYDLTMGRVYTEILENLEVLKLKFWPFLCSEFCSLGEFQLSKVLKWQILNFYIESPKLISRKIKKFPQSTLRNPLFF